MRKAVMGLATVGLAATTLLVAPSGAQAASTSWSSSGLTGVQASGTWYVSGGRLYVTGRLYDTAGDNKWVRLYVHFKKDCCALVVDNKNGNNTSVPFTFSTASTTSGIRVEELLKSTLASQEGGWVTIR
ncbi:hypothetical protein [Angustibacter luteus]|uniref:Secreted protein n=1 Tax=Angustibacter luteus TaxID=658456 RepID=A0ABW1JI07_9ACTN